MAIIYNIYLLIAIILPKNEPIISSIEGRLLVYRINRFIQINESIITYSGVKLYNAPFKRVIAEDLTSMKIIPLILV